MLTGYLLSKITKAVESPQHLSNCSLISPEEMVHAMAEGICWISASGMCPRVCTIAFSKLRTLTIFLKMIFK